jgi:hypothetical protein
MVAEISENKITNQCSKETLELIKTRSEENRNSIKTKRLSSKKLKKRVRESYKPRSLPNITKDNDVIEIVMGETKNSLLNSNNLYKKNNPFIATKSSSIGTHLGYLIEKINCMGFIELLW